MSRMRSPTRRFFLALLFSLVPAAALGQGSGIYLGVGAAPPYDELSNARSTGLSLHGGLLFPLAGRLFLGGEAAVRRFTLDDGKLRRDAGVPPDVELRSTGGAVTFWSLSPTLRLALLDPDRRITPYLLGGAGYTRLEVQDASVSAGDLTFTLLGEGDNWMGLDAGAGTTLRLSPRLDAFLEGRFSIAVDVTGGSSEHFTPFSAGLRLAL